MCGKRGHNNQQSTGMAQVGGGWQRERLGAARRRRGRMMKMGVKQRNNQPSTRMAQAGGGWQRERLGAAGR
jgi:hypothetical protein